MKAWKKERKKDKWNRMVKTAETEHGGEKKMQCTALGRKSLKEQQRRGQAMAEKSEQKKRRGERENQAIHPSLWRRTQSEFRITHSKTPTPLCPTAPLSLSAIVTKWLGHIQNTLTPWLTAICSTWHPHTQMFPVYKTQQCTLPMLQFWHFLGNNQDQSMAPESHVTW